MPTIKTETCWSGGQYCKIRLTIPVGVSHIGRPAHEFIIGDRWNRNAARQALDIIEQLYHVPRRNVRFKHH